MRLNNIVPYFDICLCWLTKIECSKFMFPWTIGISRCIAIWLDPHIFITTDWDRGDLNKIVKCIFCFHSGIDANNPELGFFHETEGEKI